MGLRPRALPAATTANVRPFAAMAKSMGWYAEGPLESPDGLAAALKRAIARVKAGQPALLDTVTQKR